MGDDFDTLIHTTNSDVELDLENVRFVGDPRSGQFLEDLNVQQPDFREWVSKVRANPTQIGALYSTSPKTRIRRPRPRVTVLPLQVLGDDPALAALGDWIAEQCCRLLSRSNLLSAISHLSGRAMAQYGITVPNVRAKLEVDYLVAGTIRSSRSGALCDIDFIDVVSGEILWNRTIEMPNVNALDALHDRIADIAQTAARTIADAAVKTVRAQPITEIADHNLMIAGVSMMHRPTMRDFLKSRDYLHEAIIRLPGAAEPLAWLGNWYVLNVFKGFTTDRAGDTQRALDCTAHALDLDPESSFSLTIDGFAANNLLKDMDRAAARYEAALGLNPNESLAWLMTGSLHAFRDDGLAAIEATRTARRLSPIDPFGYYFDSLSATAHLSAGNYAEALEFSERSLAVNDGHVSTLRAKVTALHFLGRGEDARNAALFLKKRVPNFRLDQYRADHPAADQNSGRRVLEALLAAGIN